MTASAVTMSGGSIALPGGVITTSLTMSGGVTFTGTPTVAFTAPLFAVYSPIAVSPV